MMIPFFNKNYARLLFLGGLASFGLTALQADPNPSSATIRVACVGDSITHGSGAGPGKAYPTQLQEMLGTKYEVKNFGVSARTLLRKGDHPYWIEAAFKSAQDFQPNLVVIMLGTNDTKPQNWVHQDEFYNDYKDLVKTFQDLASKPRVFVCHPCPVPPPGNFGINEANVQIEIPLIDKLAQELHLGVIDIHAALDGKPELLPDHVHPNAEGARIMAETVSKEITKPEGQ